MSSESPVVNREELERVLCQIAEVDAARVVEDENHLIQELHVLASDKKAPRQIVRDIESLLMARFGLPIDHKKISIAQINGTGEKSQPRGAGRLKITNISMDVTGSGARVEVSLTCNGTQMTGSATGVASQSGRLRAAALAALDAAARFAPDECHLTLEQFSVIPAQTGNIALVCVSSLKGTQEETFTGSAFVKVNEWDSIVKATLAAINRRVSWDR